MANQDQSSTLRQLRQAQLGQGSGGSHASTRVYAVSSGKGGVGKSNFVLNVGIALARRKKKVLIMDADMGLANIDILLGMAVRNNLAHVLANEKSLDEVIVEGPSGLFILPAASGVEWMASLSAEQKMDFLQKMDAINGVFDILLIDTGAGISPNVMYFNLAAQARIVMVTREPTSITDAYGLIKVMFQNYGQKQFDIVVNNVKSIEDAKNVYRSLTRGADLYLKEVRLGYLGHVRSDPNLSDAVLRQTPLQERSPDSVASLDYNDIADKMLRRETQLMSSELGLFWRDLFEKAPAG